MPLAVADCAPDEAARWDGSCEPVGVQDCGEGFASDDVGGCVAVVPDGDCPAGQMKILGQTACVDVASCSGKWGAAPVDAQTVYVDASYAGGSSDGSETNPWTGLQQAIDAAPSGATLAIAAGDYTWVQITKPLELWGACPTEVRIHGGYTTSDAVAVFVAAADVGLHDLAITDSTFGVVVTAPNLTLEGLMVHDLASYGLWVDGDYAPGSSATVRHSAFVRTTGTGVAAFNATVTVEESYFSDTQTYDDGESGRAIATRPGTEYASVAIDGVVAEKSHVTGVLLRGTEGTIDRLYVADTLGRDDGSRGEGVMVDDYPPGETDNFPSELTIDHLVVERARANGLKVEDATVVASAVTVRDVVRDPVQSVTNGQGLNVLAWTDPTTLTLAGALIERTVASGVFVASSGTSHGGDAPAVAELEGVVVRDIAPREDGLFGFGIYAQGALDLSAQSQLTVSDALVENTVTGAISTIETNATITNSHLRTVAAAEATGDFGGEFGDGLLLQRYFVGAPPVAVAVDGIVIEDAARAGLANFAVDVTLTNLLSSCNLIHLNGENNYEGLPYSFEVQGTNRCGCEETVDCKVLSSGLEPPPLIE
jgi:hypothetical protein